MSDYRPLTLILFILTIAAGVFVHDLWSLARFVVIASVSAFTMHFEGKRDQSIEALREEILSQKAAHQRDLQILGEKVNGLSFQVKR